MQKIFTFLLIISFIIYSGAVLVILFFGQRGLGFTDLSLMEYINSSSNFVPFKTIGTYVAAIFDGSMNRDIPIKNLAGNLILFLPMGVYLPFFFRRLDRISLFSGSMIILLFALEAIQLVTMRGSFDIDDFILNMMGALIGFAIWKMPMVRKLLRQKVPADFN
jgi:glycopeptide antibiotics resistance protein